MPSWPILGITIIQSILILAQWFICRTWIAFWFPQSTAFDTALYTAVFLVTLSFVFSALLGFRYTNPLVALFYKISATWLGFLNYFFLAVILCRLIALGYRLAAVPAPRPLIAGSLFSLAVLTSIYGLVNAQSIRIRRVPIHLENIPASWHGRTAVLLSDLHLGNINALAFSHDGKLLATGSGEPSRGGEIKLWNPADGILVRDLPNVHTDAVFGLDFSPDDKFLASGAADKMARVVELASGKVIRSFEGHTHRERCHQFRRQQSAPHRPRRTRGSQLPGCRGLHAIRRRERGWQGHRRRRPGWHPARVERR